MNEIYFKKIIENELAIEEINENDIEDLFELFSNFNVCKYMGFFPVKDKQTIIDMIKRTKEQYLNKETFMLGIKIESKLIGYIGLSKYDLSRTTCQVVYALNEMYWHKGIMVRALKLFVKYLIEVEKKELIIATHIDENISSGKVMEKAGFKRDPKHDTTMLIKGTNRQLIGYTIKVKE